MINWTSNDKSTCGGVRNEVSHAFHKKTDILKDLTSSKKIVNCEGAHECGLTQV